MLTGITEIDQGQLKNLMRFAIRRGTNILTFGAAGTGKTEMAMQACTDEDIDYIYLNLSVLEAPDLMGLPCLSEENGHKSTTYALPEMLPRKGTGKEKVLLVDEADKAKPELQNPCLELFQFRSINGKPLDVKAVIATGNLPDEGAFSQPMSHALTNRCAVFRVSCAFEPWREWAVDNSVNNLIVGFLSKNQEYLLQPPPEGDETAYCHPSPRAWTLAARDLDGTMGAKDLTSDVDFQTLLVAGRVGQGAAVKFKVWLEHYRFIEPIIDALAKNGTKPDTSKMTIDRQLVCALGAVGRMMAATKEEHKGNKDAHKKEVHKVTSNVMDWLKELPSEFQIAAVKSTLSMKVIQDFELTKIKPFMDAYLKIRQALKQD
jgi:hypothetical protein